MYTDAKRLIGRKFMDSTVQSDMKLWPFRVVADRANKPMIVVNYKGVEKQFLPEELPEELAIQSVVLSGARSNIIRDIVLLDVTPLSLGVKTLGEVLLYCVLTI